MQNKYVDPKTLCEDIFALAYPPSENALKTRYKELIKVHHPDKGGDARNFIKVQDAFKVLQALTIQDNEERYNSDFTSDGHRKSELGLGYSPPMPTCEKCNGFGYCDIERTIVTNIIRCQNCRGWSMWDYLSKKCALCSNDRFVGTKTQKIMEERCTDCNGKGQIYLFNPVFRINSL